MEKFFCPMCKQTYTPKHTSHDEAFATEDMESREQWLSGVCSNACWNTLAGDFDEEPDSGGMAELN